MQIYYLFFKKPLFISVSLLLAFSTAAIEIDTLASSSWLKISSSNFEIITDFDEQKAQYMIQDLENFRHFTIDLMQLQVLDGLPPLKIIAINSKQKFKNLNLPDSYAGMFGLSLNGYAAIASVNDYKKNAKAHSFGRQVLLHEYVHHLMRFTKLTRKYPKWYDEGNADYLGTFRWNKNQVYIGDYNAMGYSASALAEKTGKLKFNSEWLMNTNSLNMKSKRNKDNIEASAFYEQSFFLVNYINTSTKLKKSLQNYLYDIYLGYPQDLSFKRSFKMTYEELDDLVIKYLKKGAKMSAYSTKNKHRDDIFFKHEFKVSTLSKADFYYEMSDIIAKFNNFSKETKKDIFNKAIEYNPQQYDLQAKALMYGLLKNTENAIKKLELNIPDNSSFLTFKGEQKRHQADMLRLTGADDWEEVMLEARSYYRRAIKADPFNSAAYMGLGKVYMYLPETEPLREGIIGFDQASVYMRNEETFIAAANLALRMKDTSKAIMMLRNGIAFGNQVTRETYGYILDNLELLLELTGAIPILEEKTLIYEEGSFYQGSLKDGKPHGRGKITRVNGSYYEGEFINGIMQGKGHLWSVHGNTHYEGNFQDGIMHGKAIIKLSEILPYTEYTGNVEYGQPHGKGTYVSDKGTYIGQFWRGMAHGRGEFITPDNNHYFTGRWIYGNYEWPELHGEIYIGGMSHKGWRIGNGLCRPANSYTPITSCEYFKNYKLN